MPRMPVLVSTVHVELSTRGTLPVSQKENTTCRSIDSQWPKSPKSAMAHIRSHLHSALRNTESAATINGNCIDCELWKSCNLFNSEISVRTAGACRNEPNYKRILIQLFVRSACCELVWTGLKRQVNFEEFLQFLQ